MNNYQILIGENIFEDIQTLISPFLNDKVVFIITDRNVYKLYHLYVESILTNLVINWVITPVGEKAKSLKVYNRVINNLLDVGIKRNSLILSIGGGVVGDLAGFVSATLFRGIKYIQIPTTLLSQVDSSVGSKTGINHPKGKNLIGSFYDPSLVIIDPLFLNTLNKREYNNGIAEVIKCGLIKDKTILADLNVSDKVSVETIVKALIVKQSIVLADPYEDNIRKFLNFGHTFGHAIENRYGYRKIKHGEAVSYGMLFSLILGIKLGITKDGKLIEEIKTLLNKYSLLNKKLLPKNYINYMFHDKKSTTAGINFIFIEEIENPVIKLITREDLYENFAK